jgi:hypothetical protein
VIDEHALSRAAGDGVRAQSLLENEMLKGAFKALEDSYMAAWRATTIDEVGSREKLFLATAGAMRIICETPVLRSNRR